MNCSLGSVQVESRAADSIALGPRRDGAAALVRELVRAMVSDDRLAQIQTLC